MVCVCVCALLLVHSIMQKANEKEKKPQVNPKLNMNMYGTEQKATL